MVASGALVDVVLQIVDAEWNEAAACTSHCHEHPKAGHPGGRPVLLLYLGVSAVAAHGAGDLCGELFVLQIFEIVELLLSLHDLG